MRPSVILAIIFSVASVSAPAAQSYSSYDAFYAAQPGTAFNEPIRRDTNAVYFKNKNQGIYTILQTKLAGKSIRIQVAKDYIEINGKTHNFLRATTLPGESIASIYPDTANVFLAAQTGNRPPLLCVEGHSSGSGETDRYRQIFLLINPLDHNPTFLHLPGLLSSCRAVLTTSTGQPTFPKNSYIVDEAQATRTGLRVSYFIFEHGRFVPTSNEIHLRFANPENPFQFSSGN